jgi:spectinomycin phosphotransferase
MLEKPDLKDEKIVACLRDAYGLCTGPLVFLPLGADMNAAVYRAVTDDGTPYFVKLKRGVFEETAVALPKFLRDQGIAQIIAPLQTKTGQLWAEVDAFKLILYPFIVGCDGREKDLSDVQWIEFGAALKKIQTVTLPSALKGRIPSEDYSPRWREIVKSFLDRPGEIVLEDPVAVKTDALLKRRRDEIADLVGRAGRLAAALQARSPEFVLCHSDVHEANVLIDAEGRLYIVDWDNPILAPKERDLMFIGGGICGVWNQPRQETLFYRGYGRTEIDPVVMAYYRCNRIVEDIAIYCQQLLLSAEGGEDREQSFQYLASIFLPNGVLEIALKSDPARNKV